MVHLTIPVGGMHCQHCAGSVKEALSALSGIKDVQIDLGKGHAVVSGDDLNIEAIRSAIEGIGFDAGNPL